MLKNRGFTLLETLFAFQVYLCIILIIFSFMHTLHHNQLKLSEFYKNIESREERLSKENDIIEIIDMVLR